MKRILSLLAAAGTLIPMTYAADQYSVFKICEDKHVIHTSDGADAGHIEYIITDPAHQQIVSAICTGGVLADRLIQVPFDDFAYGDGNEVTINFDRQRLASAPVIEQNVLISGARLDPGIVERSVTYFGGRNGRNGEANRGAVERGNARNQPGGEGRIEPGSRNVPGAVSTDPNAQSREGRSPSARGDQRNSENLRATEGKNGEANRGAAERGSTRNQPAGEGKIEPGSRNAPGAASTDPNVQPREGRTPAATGDQRNPENLKSTGAKNGEAKKEERGARTAKPETGASKAETQNEKTPPTKRTDVENGSPKSEERSGATAKGEEKSERSTGKTTTRPESRTPSEPAKAGAREGSRPPEKGEKSEKSDAKPQ